MGETLTALTSDSGISLVTIVAIEGIPYLLTDGDPDAAEAAWSGTDWTSALGGLVASVRHDQRIHPWEPFKSSSSSCSLQVMDASGTNADTFGKLVFKREGMNSTRLTADLEPGDTTINVQSTSTFAGSGYVYIGNETIGYTSTTGTTFGTLTRGKWSPFAMEAAAPFERTHRVTPTVPGVPAEATTSTTVTDEPINWKGRWVGVWIHRSVGGVLATKAEAHLAFAGTVATVNDSSDGSTVILLDEVRDRIGDTIVMREQFQAKVVPRMRLSAGDRFLVSTKRGATIGAGDALVVVAAGATPPYEIDEGTYPVGDVEDAINAWLAAEYDAGNVLFSMTFAAAAEDADGNVRSRVTFSDPTTTTDDRVLLLRTLTDTIAGAFGWANNRLLEYFTSYSGSAFSEEAPLQFNFTQELYTELAIEEVAGSFVDQASLVPQALTFQPPFATLGLVRIGDFVFSTDEAPVVSGGSGTMRVLSVPLNRRLGEPADNSWRNPVSADGRLEVEQILVLQAPFKTLMLTLLSSTGGGLNWTGYDILPEHCSAAIPYELMGTGLETELAGAWEANEPMTITVEKPTRLVDLFNVSTVLRLVQLVWRQGRLALRGSPTPTSAATLEVLADHRARPVQTVDPMTAVTSEVDELVRNVIKIRHGANVYGEDFRDTTTIVDPGSASSFGARPLTLEAINSNRTTTILGDDVQALVPRFIAGLTFLSRPALTVRVPVPYILFETATAGEVCLFSDPFARDPSTGERGISAKPALITANRFDWGGPGIAPTGEIDVMLFPRLSLAEYSPCAEVNAAATNAGYDAGTKVLTLSAHEHSPAGSTTHDAARFVIGDKVRVVEIDPPTAAAPLTWTDTVAGQTGDTVTLTAGLAGWDNTKKYRLISDGYSTAVTAQRADTYQADDADGLIANLRSPYGLAWSPLGVESYTDADPSTEFPARPPTTAYGDGKPLDTGHARDLARGCNSLVSYATPQQPACCDEVTFSGSGTYRWVWTETIYVGLASHTTDRIRKLYVAPHFRSGTGGTAKVRVTVATKPPRTADPTSPSRDDVIRVEPYSEHEFTTTSTTYATPTAFGISLAGLGWNHSQAPGLAYVYVEIVTDTRFRGLATCYVGPVEAP